MSGVTAAAAARFQQLQALDDAICWRTGRLVEPCADCETASAGRCDDHDCDLGLIAAYHLTARTLCREAGDAVGLPSPTGVDLRVAAADGLLSGHQRSAVTAQGALFRLLAKFRRRTRELPDAIGGRSWTSEAGQ
jgi:hypothetical protein